MCLAENSFYTTWYCGIVCAFQRTVFIPPGIVFQRTVFIPPGIVRVFREQFSYRLVLCVLFREQSSYRLVLCVLFREQFSTPPHSFTSQDEVSTPGIVSNEVNFLFLFVLYILVKVRISETISSFKVIGTILE